jgi:hypothetical protein
MSELETRLANCEYVLMELKVLNATVKEDSDFRKKTQQLLSIVDTKRETEKKGA